MEEYKIGIADALLSLRNGAEWTVHSDDTIEWLSNDFVQPTDAEIQAEIVRLQTEYDFQEYTRNRKEEYPDIGDQLDDLYHAGMFSDDMTSKLKAVKEKYPKE
jgi:hypothetical protein